MHARTYADAKVLAFAERFVWILVDTNVSVANADLADAFSTRLEEELSEYLSYPTAVFLDAEGKLVKSASGFWEPDAFVKLLNEVLGE